MSIRIKGHILEGKREQVGAHERGVWVSSLLFILLSVALFLFCAADRSDQTSPTWSRRPKTRGATSNTKAGVFSSIVHQKKKKEKKKLTCRVNIKGSGALCCGPPPGGLKEGVGFRPLDLVLIQTEETSVPQ